MLHQQECELQSHESVQIIPVSPMDDSERGRDLNEPSGLLRVMKKLDETLGLILATSE
jgi:hypothetical protein